MIFDSNTTSLGSTIPMAEGYDGTIGCAKALIESAQNDYAMFRAMLESDARELAAMNNGYVNEAEVYAIREAAASGIWNKIKELFKKLIAKIKSIFANFLAKFRGLYMKDKQLVKTYGQQVMRKSNLGNMTIKWRKSKDSLLQDNNKSFSGDADKVVGELGDYAIQHWDSDTEKRWQTITDLMTTVGNYIGKKSDGPSDFRESIEEAVWEDDSPSEYDFKDIFSGAREMINEFDGGGKYISNLEKYTNKLTRALDKKIKEYDKFANQAAKDSLASKKSGYDPGDAEFEWNKTGYQIDINADPSGKNFSANRRNVAGKISKNNLGNNNFTNKSAALDRLNSEDVKRKTGETEYQHVLRVRADQASHEYDMAVVFNDAVLIEANCLLESTKEYYKQLKAVFMKAVTVSDKKLEESSIYAQAVAEAAEDEVENVISAELDKHDNWLSGTSNASKNVLDTGVNGYELGYEPNKWSKDCVDRPTDGTKDSCIVGTSETAYFGSLLY